jgi:hypothetical protein
MAPSHSWMCMTMDLFYYHCVSGITKVYISKKMFQTVKTWEKWLSNKTIFVIKMDRKNNPHD